MDLAHKPRCRIVSLDLAEDHAWEVSEYIADACDVTAVHLAPPCGTCSKARGVPVYPCQMGFDQSELVQVVYQVRLAKP